MRSAAAFCSLATILMLNSVCASPTIKGKLGILIRRIDVLFFNDHTRTQSYGFGIYSYSASVVVS
jgi:hypothetical protein